MGSSSPQEGGTTDEDYYGQPQQMSIEALQPTAPKEIKTPTQIFRNNIFHYFLPKAKNKNNSYNFIP
jgi:hypothetical protein